MFFNEPVHFSRLTNSGRFIKTPDPVCPPAQESFPNPRPGLSMVSGDCPCVTELAGRDDETDVSRLSVRPLDVGLFALRPGLSFCWNLHGKLSRLSMGKAAAGYGVPYAAPPRAIDRDKGERAEW
jgi:hypothetical protein